MALKNRVRQYTNTIGLDNYSMVESIPSYRTFAEACSDGEEIKYCATDGADYEIGVGTIANNGLLVTRDTIIESTNNNNPVSWSTGNKDIFTVIDAASLQDAIDLDLTIFATHDEVIAMAIALG